MKRTLLFFLLLFTTIFYAQVSNIEHCSGKTAFNLKERESLLIGNLNPAETTVSYHLSLASATNNVNPVFDPTYYVVTSSSTTIYARINNNGNITTNYFNLIIHPDFYVSPSLKPIACNGRTADLTLKPSGGSGSYKYSMNGSEFGSNNVFLGLLPGTKDIQVIDNVTGCMATLTYKITEPAVITANAVVNKNTITVTAAGGTPPYQYSIDGDYYKSSNVFTNVSPGSYNIIVIDAPACRVVVPATIQPPLSSTATITKQLDCLSTGTASIMVNGVGGQTPYTYSLNGGPYQTSNIYNDLVAGTYTVTVKDAENTISSASSITIQPISPIVITTYNTTVSCNGSSDGGTEIRAAGGVAPYSYSINNGPFKTSNIIENLSASAYSITVKDATGCLATSSFTMSQPEPLSITENIVKSGVNNDGSITVSASGGSNSYIYSLKDDIGNVIRPQQVSNVFSNLPVGSYQIEVVDFRGCFLSKKVTIAPVSTLAANVTVGNITCTSTKGSISITATGGVAPYQYSINNGANYSLSNVFNNLAISSYTIKVKDAENTIITTTAAVTQTTLLTVSARTEAASIACNGDKTGFITATATGGLQPYTYSIDGTTFQSSRSFLNLGARVYNVTVKDANECLAVTSISVTERPRLSATAEIINDQNIVVTPTGGTTLYTFYLENTTTGIESGPKETGTFTKLPVGIYTVKVLDSNGCEYDIPGVNIKAPSSNALSAVSVVSQGGCTFNGRITVDAMGGKQPYEYSIDNGLNYSSSNVFTNLYPNIYTVKVRDAELNTTTHTARIKQAYAPSIDAVVTNVSCKGNSNGSIRVIANGGAGPYQFSLNGGTYYYDMSTFNNLAAGTYTISVRDNNICESKLTVEVTEPEILAATAKPSTNQGIVANVTGGTAPYSYTLENENGTIAAPAQSNNSFTNLPIGLYKLKIIDANTCSTSVSNINVIASTPLNVTAVPTNVTCSGPGTVTFNAAGGIAPYQYSVDNGVSYSLSSIFTNLASGTYSLKAKDALNTVIDLTVDIAQTTSLKVSAQILTPINCNGDDSGLIYCTATGGSDLYQYSIDGNNFQSSRYFTSLKAGTYTITVKDGSGCLAVSSPITFSAPPVLSATAVINKQSIFITSTGGSTNYAYYLENDATGIKLGPIQNGKFTALAAGTYTAIAYDSNGCTFNISGLKIEPASTALAVVAVATDIACSEYNIGRVVITATGGVPPYQYSLNNGDTYSSSNLFVGLPAYTYPVTVRDADLNIVTDVVTVKNISSVISATAVVTNVSCQGNQDGAIALFAEGGYAPYSYTINGQIHGGLNTFYDLDAGIYPIIVSDKYGCQYALTVEIKEPSPINISTKIGTDQSLIAYVVGGTAPYSYSLTDKNGVTAPAQTNNTFSNIPVGVYTLKIIDANGCGVSFTGVKILAAEPLSAIATINQPTCDNPTGKITATARGGSGGYQYSIDNGLHYSTANVFANLQPGAYNISVKDSKNTLYTSTAIITAINPLHFNATITSLPSCTDYGVITCIATGGKAPYVYSLNGGAYSSTPTFNVYGGVYTLTVKDSNGCIETLSITVDSPLQLVANFIIENQTLTINTIGGSGEIVYSLSPNLDKFSSQNVFGDLVPGNYTAIVRDANGCSLIYNLVIDPPAPLINGENQVTVEFKAGQTLADLVVEGQNIKWYSNSNNVAKKTNKSSEATLPLTTLLVDGTIYYASQTINGIESTKRLSVTAKLNGSLSTPDFTLPDFTYYPNPVQHTLSIHNTSNIDEVEIFSVSGKFILSNKVNSDHSEIDLSNVSSGVYFLKVKAEGQTKTIKIVKK
ncbi:T9SS type A sorting domain-containing protein [Flavobacterium pectinovorum]|uniref:T9SS type A sorting domain-containing protein n=1 Tax=Flavobacterium pectinovorum TaxID=29533 RepID=UPI00265FA34B|nr:T9SS type A sorting domain-containing protein [Flavobacterium pectinovorum]WKL46949.1 T9SS type A sorting domain-containing protein [Flavobacterium pectinovorum]